MKKLKIISKDKEVKKVFAESEVMAILERMEDGIRVVAEGVMGVQRQLDGLTDEVYSFRAETNARFEQVDARFEQVDARFEQIDTRFEQVDARFEQVDARFKQINARFEKVEANQKITLDHLFCTYERFEVMEKELKEIKFELARLSEKILSSKETKSFSKRIAVIEKDMEKLRIFVHSRSKLKVA
jgi:chromosome segregation ATPase